MIAKFLKIALLGVALMTQGQFASAQTGSRVGNLPAQPSAPLYKNILYVAQNTGIAMAAAGAAEARFGPLTTAKNGFGMRTNYTDVSQQLSSVGMPRISISGAQSTETVLSTSRLWVQTYSGAYFTAVKNYMLTRGISMAYFSYYQEVDISTAIGSPRRKGVMWSGTVDLNGRALYGDPRIVDAAPIYLDIQYYPLATGEGVLAEEGYPNAGRMLWRVLDRTLKPMATGGTGPGGTTVVNVAGAYDSVDEDGDVGAVSCFIDKRHPNCSRTIPAATRDAATIANSIGAAGIFAFYAQSAQLEYTQVGTTDEHTPALSIWYTKRELSCTSLKQVISVGKTILLNGNLYYGAYNGTYYEYQVMDRVNRKQVIEPASYQREALLADLASLNYDPTQTLLSPFTDPTLPQLYSLDNAAQQATKDFIAKVIGIAELKDLRKAADYVGLLSGAVKDSTHAYIMELAAPSTGGGGGGSGGGGGGTPPVQQQSSKSGKGVRPLAINTDPDTGGGGGTGGGGSVPAVSTATVEYELGVGNTTVVAPNNNVAEGIYTRTFSFNIDDKSKIDTFMLTYLAWDDYLQVSINGRQIIHTDGGDMLALGNTAEGAKCSGGYGTRPVYTCTGGGDSETCYQDGTVTEFVSIPWAGQLVQTHSNALITFNWGDAGTCGDSGCPPGWYEASRSGCDFLERARDNRYDRADDLRSYLVNGLNTITLKLVVGEAGEGWIRLRTSAVPSGCSAPVTSTPSTNPLDGKSITVQGYNSGNWANAYVMEGAGNTVTIRSLPTNDAVCTLSGPGTSCNVGQVSGAAASVAVDRLIDEGVPTDTGVARWSQAASFRWNSNGTIDVWRYAAGGSLDFYQSNGQSYYAASRGSFEKSTLQGLPASSTVRLPVYRKY